jgi:serine protease Do
MDNNNFEKDNVNTGNGESGQNGQNGQNFYQQNYGNMYQGYQNPYGQNGQQKPRREKKPHPTAKFVGKVVAAGLIFGIVAGPVTAGTNYISNKAIGNTNSSLTSTNRSKGSDKRLDATATSTVTTLSDVSDVVAEAMPSIVQVTNMSITEYQDFFGQVTKVPQKSAGSGIIINEDDDYIYIATNNHVVSNANSLTITFNDDSAVTGEVQGTDEQTDLAVVKVKKSDMKDATYKAIKVASIGNSNHIAVGESAIVIGNALGYGQSVTTGVVSALDREVTIQNEDSGKTYTNKLIQTSAAVSPGNSGGALLNAKGEVIGVVSAKYSGNKVEGMGFAIPITNAQDIVDQLMDKGKVTKRSGKDSKTVAGNGYLGVAGVDITQDMASTYNMPSGVYVAKVVKGSAADDAGIKKGDVITEMDGSAIATMEDLSSAISSKSAGDKVKLSVATVENSYQPKTVTVTLGERPEDEAQQ